MGDHVELTPEFLAQFQAMLRLHPGLIPQALTTPKSKNASIVTYDTEGTYASNFANYLRQLELFPAATAEHHYRAYLLSLPDRAAQTATEDLKNYHEELTATYGAKTATAILFEPELVEQVHNFQVSSTAVMTWVAAYNNLHRQSAPKNDKARKRGKRGKGHTAPAAQALQAQAPQQPPAQADGSQVLHTPPRQQQSGSPQPPKRGKGGQFQTRQL